MVIEHTFVTTLEQADALQTAESFLNARGFTPEQSIANGSSTMLHMRRGTTNAAKAHSVAELPQFIRIDFDRGRVALAASITPSPAWGGRSWIGSEGETRLDDTRNPNRLKLHTEMLLGIVSGIEKLLVQGAALDLAYEQWDVAESHVAEAARRRKRKIIIAVTALAIVIAGVIVLIAYSV